MLKLKKPNRIAPQELSSFKVIGLRLFLIYFVMFCWFNLFTRALAQEEAESAPEEVTEEATSGGSLTALGISLYLPVAEEVKDGDIITFTPKGYIKAQKAYDQSVVGVVTTNPAVTITIQETEEKGAYVATSGRVEVSVSSANGEIKAGDLITTSEIAGVGMKATKSGFVVGNALEDYSSNDPKAVGRIKINLNVHFFYSTKQTLSQTLTDLLSLSSLAVTEQPSSVFKYVVAAIVLLTSVGFAFFSFARIAKNGIEALGRNPLAGRNIQFGIIFNVVITIVIIASGSIIAYLIVRI